MKFNFLVFFCWWWCLTTSRIFNFWVPTDFVRAPQLQFFISSLFLSQQRIEVDEVISAMGDWPTNVRANAEMEAAMTSNIAFVKTITLFRLKVNNMEVSYTKVVNFYTWVKINSIWYSDVLIISTWFKLTYLQTSLNNN